MSAVTFFEKFLGLQQQRTESAVASYRELVAAISTGQEPNPIDVEHLLAEAGKSLDDLRKDVEHDQRRMALTAAGAATPKLKDQRRKLDEQIAAADRTLEAAEKTARRDDGPALLPPPRG